MERCDVLIVGGGPAGSSCAWRLRRAGLDALVLDQKAFPRDKPCAGWITPQVLESLQLDLDDYGRGRVFQPISGFRTGLIGGPEVYTTYPMPVSYGIRRCEFDDYLLQRSQARLRLAEPVKSLQRVDGRWIVNGTWEAPVLIGAGGHFCPVARALGARQGARLSVIAAQEVEFEASPEALRKGGVCGEVPELFFCRDLQGYAWCFRKGNFLNIGLGRLDAHELSSHVAEFCKWLRKRGKIRGEIPARFRGHAYQLYEQSQPKLVDDGVLLVGDAAGLAYPQSGEGIRPAVESGLIAADVIIAADGCYREENLEAYRARITARLGRPRAKGPSDWLPSAWLHYVAARLLATRWFSRRVLLERWFLHVHEPALAEQPIT